MPSVNKLLAHFDARTKRGSEHHGVRILLVGYFNRGNFGDDAMELSLRTKLQADVRIAEVRSVPLPDLDRRVALNGMRLLRDLIWADQMYLAGGTHFHDLFGIRSYRILLMFAMLFGLSRFLGTEPASVAIGIGPLNTRLGKALVGASLRFSKVTVVRDSASLVEARRISSVSRIMESVDLAFGLNYVSSSFRQKRILGVSIVPYFRNFHDSSLRDSIFIDRLTTAIQQVCQLDWVDEVRILIVCESQPDGDLEVSEELRAVLERKLNRHVMLTRYKSVTETVAAMQELSFLICSRYHALLVAQLIELPVLLIPYQQKCISLADQLGIPASFLLTPEAGLDETEMARAVTRLCQNDLRRSAIASDGVVQLQTKLEHALIEFGNVMLSNRNGRLDV